LNPNHRLVLASQSRSRAAILENAGLSFDVEPAEIDEQVIKIRCRDNGCSVGDTVLELAAAKASAASARHPDAYVLGADQILDLGGTWYDKPRDRDEAAEHLRAFRGKIHHLVNGLVVIRNGERNWAWEETAHMTVRHFSDRFLAGYLENSGDEILESVGAYRLEGIGAQLFDRIDGDYFTVLGLPLLPLLGYLRQTGIAEP